MATQAIGDAGFYVAVRDMLEPSNSERRRHPRQPFDCIQLVAPYAETTPTASDFRPVRCHDLSLGGISFFDDQPPTYTRWLVAMGPVPFRFYIAEVIRHTSASDNKYLIGCRFVGPLTT